MAKQAKRRAELARVTRERDSLARRCAGYFEKVKALEAEIEALKAVSRETVPAKKASAGARRQGE